MSNEISDKGVMALKEGEMFIKNWQGDLKEVERLKRDLSRAECNVANSQNALGKWMVPKEFHDDEVVTFPWGNGFLCISRTSEHNYKAWWRIKPTNME